MKKSFIRNIIIIAIVAVIAFIGYEYFLKDKNPAPATGGLVTTGNTDAVSVNAVGEPVNQNDVLSQELLVLLQNTKDIKLNSGILSSQAFNSLQDFSRPILPDTNPGRVNPFASLGADSAAISTQVSTSNPSAVTSSGSTLNGSIAIGGDSVTRWFEYGTSEKLGSKTDPKTQLTPGAFAEKVTGLLPNTTYYVKAVAQIGDQLLAGNLVTWKTAQKQ